MRVYPVFDTDSRSDFKLANGLAHRISGQEPEAGLARETNRTEGVPTYTVVRMDFAGYDAVGEPAFRFQYVGLHDLYETVPHDHRDNYNGGFAFSIYHPGTSLPQQPWVT